jgi:hypothetical protein
VSRARRAAVGCSCRELKLQQCRLLILLPVIPVRYAAAGTLIAILVTAGCSDENAGVDPKGSNSARHSASDDASQPPDDMQWVANEVGFRFAVPEAWTVIDASSVDDPKNADAIEAFADATNGAVADVQKQLRGSDQLLVAPNGQSSIYVTGVNGGKRPSEAQVKRGLSRTPDVEVDTVLTTLGDATRAEYLGRVHGTSIYGQTLYFGVEGGVGVLMISTEIYEQIAHLDRWVLSSLDEIG